MEGAGSGEKEAAAAWPATVEAAAKKRNTDCVYFLASPLTCKKGKECEYRHSEGARVNPRDCRYWLNGNCLNLKCSFRHPPLDGPIRIPGTSSSPTPPSQTVSTPQILVRPSSISHNSKKQSVSCYFYQKGQCLKGDKCSFVHGPKSIGPEPTGIPVPHHVIKVSAPVAETPKTIEKELYVLMACARQKTPGTTNEKLVRNLPLSGKTTSRTECVPTNGLTLKRSYESANVPLGTVAAPTVPMSHQSQPAEEHFQNSRDADEFLVESPPGFDVPIDNDIGHFVYCLEEGEFLRESLQDGRTPNPDSEFAANLGGVMLKGKDDYRRSGREDRHYGQELQRTSSERYMDTQVMSGKRVRCREECPDEIDRSDLRYRLLKQRRIHGPRSVVSPDGHGEPSWRDDRGERPCRKNHCLEAEKYCGRHSNKYQQHFVRKSSSSRLQGRIKIPARNSDDRPIDPQSERQHDRVRHRGGLSPTRPTLYQEGHSDKLKRKLPDDFAAAARSIGRHPVRRLDEDHLNFAGPKSLAELKGAKVLDTSQDQSNKSIDSESMSPPEDTELFSNGNAIDDALGKKGLVPEGGVDGQSTAKDLVQMERDGTNASDNPVQNEESDDVYEDDVQRIEEEERETPNDLKAEEDAYEESDAEFSDDDDDFARKVALRFS